ncbi:hypothetical protein MnTg02_02685 [bacterium MnTg02]|nr:hypothetical protein MnTg02_02685 [bacterium MnTg02]
MRVRAIALTALLLCVPGWAHAEQTLIKPTDDYCATPDSTADLAKKPVPDLKLVLSSKDLQFCSYSGEGLSEINKSWAKKNEILAYPAQLEFKDTVELIQAYSRIKSKFDVKFATIPNAMAVLARKANIIDRYVLYNKKYLCGIQNYTGSKWADDSVFAHEVGHHLANHTLSAGSRPYFELQADWFSGFILQRMGAPVDGATIVLGKMLEHQYRSGNAETLTSRTHPQPEDRIAAVAEGWSYACEQDPKCDL